MLRALQALCVLAIAAGLAGPAAAQVRDSDDTDALPRYAALDTDKAYLRAGPGKQYPIRWVYRLRGLPLVVTAVYDNWRRVSDLGGATGWVHGSLLSRRRTAIVVAPYVNLYAERDPTSALQAQLTRQAVAQLAGCRAGWCELSVDGKHGWAKRSALWGTAPLDSAAQ